MNDDIDYESLDDALDLIAAWLLAAYGTRLQRVALSIEGYYGPVTDCYGVVSVVLDRGVRSDGTPETRETLPSREVCGHAEVLFTRLYPMVRFTRQVRARRSPCRVIPHICGGRCFSASPDRVAAAVWTAGCRCDCSEATIAGTPAKRDGRPSMAPIPPPVGPNGSTYVGSGRRRIHPQGSGRLVAATRGWQQPRRKTVRM